MSFVRVWLHVVFATKNRFPYFNQSNKWEIINHIKSNAIEKSIFIDHIHGGNEHLHCLISLNGDQSISAVMQLIKGESSFWINKNKLVQGKFRWADDFYAVSVSESQIEKVRHYIRNQEEHHRKRSWEEECDEFMQKYGFTKSLG